MITSAMVSGHQVYFDYEALTIAYGAHALRVTYTGDIELLIANTDGEAEWISITESELVQSAGKPTKARKQ